MAFSLYSHFTQHSIFFVMRLQMCAGESSCSSFLFATPTPCTHSTPLRGPWGDFHPLLRPETADGSGLSGLKWPSWLYFCFWFCSVQTAVSLCPRDAGTCSRTTGQFGSQAVRRELTWSQGNMATETWDRYWLRLIKCSETIRTEQCI